MNIKNELPNILYHGSGYDQNVLSPGFVHSHKLVQWDITESNKFLYATTNREEAINLGFASALEKVYKIDRFHSDVNTHEITIDFNDSNKQVISFNNINVYLYEIIPNKKDNWIKNNNKHNSITTEWKTEQSNIEVRNKNKIDVTSWLHSKKITIRVKETPPIFSKWTKKANNV